MDQMPDSELPSSYLAEEISALISMGCPSSRPIWQGCANPSFTNRQIVEFSCSLKWQQSSVDAEVQSQSGSVLSRRCRSAMTSRSRAKWTDLLHPDPHLLQNEVICWLLQGTVTIE
jgi:hypothetical protein